MTRFIRIAAALMLLTATAASAADKLAITGSIRVRAEEWSFFDTPGRDDEYGYLASLIRVGVGQQRRRFDWNFEVAQPTLLSLPDNAVAPSPQGQLGLGASYFAANGGENVAGLFVKQASIKLKWTNDALRIGRFEFADGSEVAPKNAMLAAVKNARVAQRLIGPFGFTHVGRSLDGAQYVHNKGPWNFTAVAARPTSGAFRVHGGENLSVNLGYAALTHSRDDADERIFAIGYSDRRHIVPTDNRPLAQRQADKGDIDIATVGAHYLRAVGNFDLLAWGAIQRGDWGALDHKADALALEGGYHWTTPMKPAIRAGLDRTSGDDDARDGEHGTFFQVIPTTRAYARFPIYNMMNSTDAFVQFSIKPTAKLGIASEFHSLRLTSSNDLWYSGGGAFDGNAFGFAGRTANGHHDFARTIDTSLDYAIDAKTSVTIYGAHAFGGDVVSAIFPGDSASFVYLEFTRKF